MLIFAKVRKDFWVKDDVVIPVIVEGRLFPGWIKAVVFLKEFLIALMEFLQIPVLSIKFQSCYLMVFTPSF